MGNLLNYDNSCEKNKKVQKSTGGTPVVPGLVEGVGPLVKNQILRAVIAQSPKPIAQSSKLTAHDGEGKEWRAEPALHFYSPWLRAQAKVLEFKVQGSKFRKQSPRSRVQGLKG
jgi:hypothetical protein